MAKNNKTIPSVGSESMVGIEDARINNSSGDGVNRINGRVCNINSPSPNPPE